MSISSLLNYTSKWVPIPLHPRPGHHTDYLDEEVKAVDVMCSSLVTNPLNYGFLVTQATFLLKKNRPDLAVELARAAVNANPSEYATWAILTESYIATNDFENVHPSQDLEARADSRRC